MQKHLKLIVAIAVSALAGVAGAQTTTTTTTDPTRATDRSAGEVSRDTSNAAGRAANAAVTPGDQNMGRNPENRSGGLMGNDRAVNDRANTDSATTDGGRSVRQARADRG